MWEINSVGCLTHRKCRDSRLRRRTFLSGSKDHSHYVWVDKRMRGTFPAVALKHVMGWIPETLNTTPTNCDFIKGCNFRFDRKKLLLARPTKKVLFWCNLLSEFYNRYFECSCGMNFGIFHIPQGEICDFLEKLHNSLKIEEVYLRWPNCYMGSPFGLLWKDF